MTDSEERACAQCRFSVAVEDDVLECRCNPPETIQIDDGGTGVAFPLVMADLWCGQFSRRVN